MASYYVYTGEKNDVVLNKDSMYVSGGVANNTVNSSGTMFVYSRGEVNNTFISSGWMYISGGKANNTIVSGGGIEVSSGGTANETILNFRSYLRVSSGGTAINASVNGSGGSTMYDSGAVDVSSRGVAIGTVVEGNGYFRISSGGTASNTIQNGGVFYLYSGGFASGTIVNGGAMYANPNTRIYDTTVNLGGKVYVSGIAGNIMENGGYVETGAYGNVTFVPNTFSGLNISSYTSTTVHSGTIAKDVIITYPYGFLGIYSGGILTGRLISVKYASVSAFDGATIDFDLTSKMPNCAAIINRLTCIKGNPNYSITINNDQSEGIYYLADEVDAFSKEISVVNSDREVLGVLTVGESSTISGITYSLNLSDGQLSLTIGDKNTPPKYTSDGLVIEKTIQSVENNEIFYDTYILPSGELNVMQGGIATNTNVYSNGHLSICADAEAISTTVNSGGEISVSEKGLAINTMINSGGLMHLSSGGTITGQMVFDDNAVVSVEEGAIFDFDISNLKPETVVGVNFLPIQGSPLYTLTVSDTQEKGIYAIADNVTGFNTHITVQNALGNVMGLIQLDDALETENRRYTINLENKALCVICELLAIGKVIHNETVHVSEHEIYRDTTVNILGNIHISSGGIANNTEVNSGGEMFIFSGGRASNTVLNSKGKLALSGGIAYDLIVNSDGQTTVSSSAVVVQATIKSGGNLTISSFGFATNTTVDSNGSFYAESNAVVNTISVNSGGKAFFYDGSKLTGQLSFSDGAIVSAYVGTNIDFDISELTFGNSACLSNLSLVSGWEGANYTITVSSSQEKGVYLLAENAALFDKGITIQDALGESFGVIAIDSPLEIDNNLYTLNKTDGVLSLTLTYLTPNRIVDNESVSVCEYEIYRNATVQSNGAIHVSSNGLVNNTSVNQSGFLYVSLGGVANYTTINTLGSMGVASGGTANSTTINAAGKTHIYYGGSANSTTVNSYGSLHISSGGIAFDTTVNSSGSIFVASGGTATNISASSGACLCFDVSPNTIISGTSKDSSFKISNGIVSNYTINSLGRLLVTSGGIVKNSIVTSGELIVSSGGRASDTIVEEDGSFTIFSNGIANSTTVNPRGILKVFSGGTAQSVKENGGCVIVEDGSTLSFASNTFSDLVLETDATVHSGTTANKITIEKNGCLDIYSGGTANNAEVNYYGDLNVFSGGTANNTVINDEGNVTVLGEANTTIVNGWGVFSVASQGVANRININDCGSAFVGFRGTASVVTVQSNALLSVLSGGKITGRISFADGAYISAYTGAIFDFDLTSIEPDASARINNLSVVRGTPTYTVTVSNAQKDGSYTLANHADSFNEVITIQNVFGQALGKLSVDESITIEKVRYSLNLSKDNLILTISGSVPTDTIAPTISQLQADITDPTNQDITIAAVFTDNVQVAQTLYRIGLQGEWKTYKDVVVISKNNTIYFKAVDSAGNESEVVSYTVSNIDTTAPEKPIATADITDPTFGIVTVSASFSEDSVKREYSLDSGKTWQDYSAAIEFTENGTVLFRGTDAAGNTSYVTAYEVTNIETDSTKPTVSNVKADITDPTNKDVTITADFADDTDLAQSLYRIGETGEWKDYTDGVTVTNNAIVYFKAIDAAGNESEVASCTVSNIDRDAPTAPSGLMAIVSDPTVVLIWSPSTDTASGLKEYVVEYSCNGQTFTASVSNTNHVLTGLTSGSWTWGVQAVDIAGNESALVAGNSFVVSGAVIVPENLVGSQDKVSWNSTGAEQYVVEYSTDNFAHVIQVVTSASATDLLDLPVGTYQWRVKADDGNSDWAVGEAITVKPEADAVPKVVQSNADGNDDLFFATANGTWENIYYAQNVGSINDWTGTNEIISANGKGRIQNLFFGSSDPNVLCLTDGENGDAIFVDDVYTDSPEDIAKETSRLYKIQEVRAGAGDDIVDMTSQRFEYVGDGLTIRGGDGNDTIWATKGDNFLFGDAGNDRIVGASGNDVIAGGIGNDRMHGGGGDDIFTFGENWGTDTVEQLATGSVTLWFASGDESKWNADTMTYTDGENSVKVTGVSEVTLKFGDNTTEQYATLAQAGAFLDFTSERIFEETGKGVLASL